VAAGLIRLNLVLWLGLLAGGPSLAASPCDLDAAGPAQWSQLRGLGWAGQLDSIDAIAMTMLDCFDAPDPAVRDGLVFEAWSGWLRADRLTVPTRLTAVKRLHAALESPADPVGFRRPFAALLLSELVRADRLQAYLDAETRAALANSAGRYMQGLDDYRGFVDGEGWRHGVAHAADLILQLGVNQHVARTQRLSLLRVLLGKVAPPGTQAYRFGEPERLARALYFSVANDAEVLTAIWPTVQALADPAPLATWGESFTSEAGLARRHNTLAFLHELAFAFRAGPHEALRDKAGDIDRLLTRVMGG
jgi:hypothetical protein